MSVCAAVALIFAPSRSRRNPGTVDPECDVTELCKETAEEVRRICRYYQMPVPNIGVETHDVTTDEHADLKFAFIPGIISYIVQEILKNSVRATLELYSSDLDRHPIHIIICREASVDHRIFAFLLCPCFEAAGPHQKSQSTGHFLGKFVHCKSVSDQIQFQQSGRRAGGQICSRASLYVHSSKGCSDCSGTCN